MSQFRLSGPQAFWRGDKRPEGVFCPAGALERFRRSRMDREAPFRGAVYAMTRDEALQAAIDACTQLQRVCAEVGDLETAKEGSFCRRTLLNRLEALQRAKAKDRR